MAAYSILVGFKGEERTPIAIGIPSEINSLFKSAVAAGKSDYDKIEIVTTRTGRTRRKRFVDKPKPTKKTSQQRKKPKDESE